MDLSAELFEQIVKGLRSDGTRGVRDRRTQPRVGVRATVSITASVVTDDGWKSTHVKTRDISRDGICFISQTKLPPGTEVTAELPNHDGGTIHIKYVVRNCRKYDAREFVIGAAIVQVAKKEPAKPKEEAA